jgi:hypothetical protein
LRLLEENKDNIDVAEILTDIGDLKVTFDKIIITTTSIQAVPDEASNVTVLKSESTVKITPEVFQELQKKVKLLRSNFIS